MRVLKMIKAVLSVSLLSICLSTPLHAGSDDLYLNGVVKEISGDRVVVDVQSLSCRGTREFRVADEEYLQSLSVGREIFFSIDSSECKPDEVYTIKEVD